MNELNSIIEQEQDRARESIESRQERYSETLKNQFVSLPMAIFIDQKAGKLTHMDICLYCYLLAAQRQKAYSYWSIESLALATGYSEGGVKTSLHRLKQCGHIRRKRTQATALTSCLTKVASDEYETWIWTKGVKGTPTKRKEVMARQVRLKADSIIPRVARKRESNDDETTSNYKKYFLGYTV